ncbi:hypothetical protein LCGC14_2975640 [marine sediment metagenome]|uniref:Uncharacterized protein n=1 Tax=marine sediment metagenome TaxID=412755 RepID=A0A0F8ZFP5_9ZZZZ
MLLYEFGRGGATNACERLEKVVCLKFHDKLPFFNEKLIPNKKLQVELVRQIIYDLALYQSVKITKELFKDSTNLIKKPPITIYQKKSWIVLLNKK